MIVGRRRVGATGQIERQGRSHDAPDCGSYRLVRRVGPSEWEVALTAACDDGRLTRFRFVSRDQYDRHF